MQVRRAPPTSAADGGASSGVVRLDEGVGETFDRLGSPYHRHHDVVVVGARAAGSATAMLLARSGLRVLAVDRQPYGSDTLSSHALMRGAVRRLGAWGVLDAALADTPLITRTVFDYGGDQLALDISPEPDAPGLAAPRRTVLDPALVDAAVASGAQVLHETRVLELLRDGDRVTGVHLELPDGRIETVTADLVIGADGLRSSVARAVGASITASGRHASGFTMRYYEDLDVDRSVFRWMYGDRIGGGVIPTSAGQTIVFTAVPPQRFRSEVRSDASGTHRHVIAELDPALGAAVDRAQPVAGVRTFPGVVGRFRQAQGEGWALVGDAGYFKDPYAAHGLTDAFRDAELLTAAVLRDDLAGYEARRDELSRPLFDVLDRIASYEWDLDELRNLHRCLSIAMRDEDEATRPVAAV